MFIGIHFYVSSPVYSCMLNRLVYQRSEEPGIASMLSQYSPAYNYSEAIYYCRAYTSVQF